MKRVPIIDFVRFASIWVVIGNHFYPNWVAAKVQSPFLQKMILSFFLNGGYGVTCFFVVSGFLITQMLAEEVMDVLMHVDRNEFFILPTQDVCCESQDGMAVGDPVIADDEVCCERPPFQLWIFLEKA